MRRWTPADPGAVSWGQEYIGHLQIDRLFGVPLSLSTIETVLMTVVSDAEPITASFRIHPRAIAALGKDLVTNDVVAVIELVKNSYDALATRVDVKFAGSPDAPSVIEILDNGHGMTQATLRDVWCVVATPFRKNNPVVKRGPIRRKVTGDKGLGRLSAARLGSGLELVTKSPRDSFWLVRLDWDEIASATSLEQATFKIQRLHEDPEGQIRDHGTRIRITNLRSTWTKEKIADLREHLARMISPFAKVEDFRIYLTAPGDRNSPEQIEIEAPGFLSEPKYTIRGRVDRDGNVLCSYEYRPLVGGKERRREIEIPWIDIAKNRSGSKKLRTRKARCGPFEFEIRAWDLGAEDTDEIHGRFEIAKSSIRDAIRAHKGISLYRDNVLVLPKSDDARDWLGLDLRRVSRVGLRLSTSQIVGYVRITKEANPEIEDTSDREGLVENQAVADFRAILWSIIQTLESERAEDRRKPQEEKHAVELLAGISAKDLLSEIGELAKEKAPVSEALPLVADLDRRLEMVRSALETRFTYYSRLATVGTIAQLLVHEIRNRTNVIGWTLKKLGEFLNKHPDEYMEKQREAAVRAVDALENLADRFAPLASRTFRRGQRTAVLEECIERALDLFSGEINRLGVRVESPGKTRTEVRIDPGELESVLINLVSNALYWLGKKEGRLLAFRLERSQDNKRVTVYVDDSGPGVPPEDADRIFWPGVTRKPGGIGMGLTVASEIVAEHGGKMALIQPGVLGGATFCFDLPART